jgi:hypothetical protein
MSRRGVNFVLPILVALVLAMPLAARDNGSKNSKAITTTTMDVLSQISLGGKMIQPGTYQVSADDSKVTLAKDGKIVAQASVEWKDENSKVKSSNFVTVNEQIKEIHFGGKMRYVEIAE